MTILLVGLFGFDVHEASHNEMSSSSCQTWESRSGSAAMPKPVEFVLLFQIPSECFLTMAKSSTLQENNTKAPMRTFDGYKYSITSQHLGRGSALFVMDGGIGPLWKKINNMLRKNHNNHVREQFQVGYFSLL